MIMEILLISPGFILAIIIVVIYEIKLKEPRNKVHFYVARDKFNNILYLYLGKPIKDIDRFHACHNTKVSRTAISNCLSGLSKKAGGFIWKKNY